MCVNLSSKKFVSPEHEQGIQNQCIHVTFSTVEKAHTHAHTHIFSLPVKTTLNKTGSTLDAKPEQFLQFQRRTDMIAQVVRRFSSSWRAGVRAQLLVPPLGRLVKCRSQLQLNLLDKGLSPELVSLTMRSLVR